MMNQPDDRRYEWWVSFRIDGPLKGAQIALVEGVASDETEAVRAAHEILGNHPAWQLVNVSRLRSQPLIQQADSAKTGA